ncbi:myricetin 3-O-rhamnoside 1,2-glucosyltransferase UGT709G2-like [Phragmites australis]|uniref:myricetin 3-O-rhamnoside 1,2-glucosyltransferase UGT709G2-like n=1 Tax=Phragmites australis TaxID=29695 RepID=UPI002D7673D2|nr:myricetin 3-O-rhamnoside 1,2-glucosyltransferase UGT709G2-like [Phragmites australis]
MAASHVLVFPWPLQGHINCMLHFATGLAAAGVHVTFLHTDHNLRRLARASAAGSPRLRFLSIPDGLPDDHPRSVGDVMELAKSLLAAGPVAYRALLSALLSAVGSPSRANNAGVDPGGGGCFPSVTCVVADGLMPWAINIAEDLSIPAFVFRTASACSFLAYLSVPKLFELGELPFPEGGDLDEPVRGVPEMERFLRRRDLPSLCRRRSETNDVDPMLQLLAEFTVYSGKARALILNTAASLERSALQHITPHMRDVFAIGPLHAMSPAPAAASSLWREDEGCMSWLDGQADRSVVYVSLGSLAVISHEQFTEFLSGLVATGYPFLWVLRPDMVGASQDSVLQETVRAAGDSKVRVVAWALQRDVLRHRAVGCFLTHSGCNSTLEGIVEGVPMICWPFFADQQINSRFVGAVWRTGLDMKDVCDRAVVERMVREAMESAGIRGSARALAQQVRRDIADGGSSAMEFERLVKLIRELGMSDAEPDLQA